MLQVVGVVNNDVDCADDDVVLKSCVFHCSIAIARILLSLYFLV